MAANDRLAALHDRLSAQVEDLVDSDRWKQFLAVAARFHRYDCTDSAARARRSFRHHRAPLDKGSVVHEGRLPWAARGDHHQRRRPGRHMTPITPISRHHGYSGQAHNAQPTGDRHQRPKQDSAERVRVGDLPDREAPGKFVEHNGARRQEAVMAKMVERAERATLARILLGQEDVEPVAAELRERVKARVASSPELLEAVGGRRHRVLGADVWVLEPGTDLMKATRYAEVSVYDYEDDVLLSVVVDVDTGRVVEVRDYAGFQPPPTADEVQEAADLVVHNEPALTRRKAVPTAVGARESSMEGHAAYGHRALTLWFWTGQTKARQVAGPFLVDLSRQVVLAPAETRSRPSG